MNTANAVYDKKNTQNKCIIMKSFVMLTKVHKAKLWSVVLVH